MMVFRNITVMPTQELLHGMGRTGARRPSGIFRGGPLWPFFHFQVRARHCRGLVPFARDRKPRLADPVRTYPEGVWCGPVSPHFGHMIADFGMRIAAASHAGELPLVFSAGAEAPAPEPFFWQLLAHFGVPPSRVLLVEEPTRFEALHVPTQAERLGGPGPSPAHLDLMDGIVAAHGPVEQDIACLFVSRARFMDGRMAAEPYLAQALGLAGATVVYPETLSVADQLSFYRRARAIVFSEGSAVHALQLLGRIDAHVRVLVRRPRSRIARAALRPRVRSLAYWDFGRGQVHGLNPRGRPQWDRALALMDEGRLLEAFSGLGLDLTSHWDSAAFAQAIRSDIERWIAYNRHWNLHPKALDAIKACLASLAIDVDADRAWQTRLF